MNLEICPGCGQRGYDRAVDKCLACGSLGTSNFDTMTPGAILEAFTRNVQLRLDEMRDLEFQQVLGMLSGPAHDPEAGIKFSASDATIACRHLVKNKIPCVHVQIGLGKNADHSLIFAKTNAVIDQAVAVVHKLAEEQHMAVAILKPPLDN